ncbi:nucleotidase [Peribacillus kribbensis]|uniref:nucleotidase n=1 Tax=Peribacillus kribbensis TaxID=356658 RepID=UPI000401C604|nr:nucleotidase [Peribacillus kribbensis]
MRKRFGIDIDGTITRPDALLPFINKEFNLSLTIQDITQYELTPFVNVPGEVFSTWFKKTEPLIYAESPIASGAKDALTKWKDEHELIIISARSKSLLDVTEAWFKKQDLAAHHIELVGSHDKVAAAIQHKVDIFFEDKHDNAVAIAEHCRIPVLLFNAPYNQDPVPENVVRVKDWHEAKHWVGHWLKHKEKQ